MSEICRRDCGEDRMGAGRPVRRRQELRVTWPGSVVDLGLEESDQVCIYFKEPAGVDMRYEKKRIVKGESRVFSLSN